MTNQVVGVIGAGVMGAGVAQNLAMTGQRAILIDISEAILEHARTEIFQSLRFQGLFNKSEKRVDTKEIISLIEFTTDQRLLSEADFVIENVTEKWEIKKQVYEQIDSICPQHCVFAANTSAIPITRIASATRRAPQVLGIHFMNPVPLKSTVEVIRGYHTSEQTLETALALLARMGKTGIVVNDSPGFVSNRVLMLTINEAIFLLQDGVASAEDIDTIFKNCFGHKMGPLETADLIGLDTILYSIEVLYEAFNDSKYRPCPLLKKMVDAGLHGRKTGTGFYKY
ncbi:MAG TPA: 3-hydroxyacyl-CoA dehydrogenase NAD-binding domain-containing protein [Pyrinomonadaceae bacterium]|nr:3-hydroxyacyl-CoA dehydrogenase NAD-binding domain-containing protein [Pyrinomonadaceae bacterium]